MAAAVEPPPGLGIRPKKRVRWPDIEGVEESCFFEVQLPPLPSSDEESEAEEEEREDGEPVGEEEEREDEEEEEEVAVLPTPSQDSPPPTIEEEAAGEISDGGSEEDEEDEEEEDEEEEEPPREKEDTIECSIDTSKLYLQISELEQNLLEKSSGMERIQSELEAVYNESELARKRFKRLQDELESCKRCNQDLVERLNQKSENETKFRQNLEEGLKKADERVSELERLVSTAKDENVRMHASMARLEKERQQEILVMQQTLDDALRETEQLERRFGREFEQLRTVNANSELKLVEDFEWKLREVQKDCKKLVQEKEKSAEQKILELTTKLSAAEAQIEKVHQLEICEIELKQVRVSNQELKRNLRMLNRKYEELQVSEKVLQEEINRMRGALEKEKANFSSIETLHKDDLAQKDRKLQLKLEAQKNRLSIEWEDKFKRELSRQKSELERTFKEEKLVAVKTAEEAKEHEASQYKQIWDRRIQETLRELDNLKKNLAEKDDQHKRDLENAQTKYDSNMLELRRKMDKLDMSYQEKIEKMQETNDQEIVRLKEEFGKKVQQYEENLHMQVGTTRTTLELVKQQLKKESDMRIQQLKESHKKELEMQRQGLVCDKEAAVERLQENHKELVQMLRNEISSHTKACGSKEEQRTDANKPKNVSDTVVTKTGRETQLCQGRPVPDRLDGDEGQVQADQEKQNKGEGKHGKKHVAPEPKQQCCHPLHGRRNKKNRSKKR